MSLITINVIEKTSDKVLKQMEAITERQERITVALIEIQEAKEREDEREIGRIIRKLEKMTEQVKNFV